MTHLQVLTTTDSLDAAQQIARAVVEARVAACAQIIGPILSLYWWNGVVETTEEWQILMKTTGERYDALEAVIRQAHGYDVPEIIAMSITHGGADYLSWVDVETRPR